MGSWFSDRIADILTAWRVYRVLRKTPYGAHINITQYPTKQQ